MSPGLFAELLHRPRWLLAGVVVATLVVASRFVTIGLSPPSFKFERQTHATGSTQLLVGQPHTLNSSAIRSRYVTSAVPLAQTLADLMSSPEVRRLIARDAGIPENELAVDTPVWQGVLQTQQFPSAGKRDSELVVEGVPYRIAVDVSLSAPVLTISTQAPTPAGAAALANASRTGLNDYLTELQRTTETPQDGRYNVSEVVPVSASPPGRSGIANIALFSFVTVMFIWCGAMLFFSNVVDDLRVLGKRSKVRDPSVRS
jgi:hypothetical protein